MKKIISLLVILSFLITPLVTLADDPSAPGPPPCPTGSSPKAGSGAPIADCVPFTLMLALLYGAYKVKLTAGEKSLQQIS